MRVGKRHPVRGVLAVLLLVILLTADACGGRKQPPVLEFSTLLNQIEGDRLTDGTLAVVVNAQDEELQLDLIVQAEAGILFQRSAVVAVDEEERRQGFIRSIAMRAHESRQIPFPYQVDPDTAFSGEYVIEILAMPFGRAETIAERTTAYVQVEGRNNVRFLSSQQEFDELLEGGHSLLETGFSALLRLEDTPQPTRGSVTLKVTSIEDGYTPRIIVSVLGGIEFDAPDAVESSTSSRTVEGFPGTIAATGSRILEFPFRLDPKSLDGTYVIEVLAEYKGGEKMDQIPVAVKVLSSTAKPGGWLALQESSLP